MIHIYTNLKIVTALGEGLGEARECSPPEILVLARNLKFLSFYIVNPIVFYTLGIFLKLYVLLNKLQLWKEISNFYRFT